MMPSNFFFPVTKWTTVQYFLVIQFKLHSHEIKNLRQRCCSEEIKHFQHTLVIKVHLPLASDNTAGLP